MNNYDKMTADALRRFAAYDPAEWRDRAGVEQVEDRLYTQFLGETVMLDHRQGTVAVGGQPADFAQTLSVLDWVCDGAADARAAEEYCTVSSLPGVLVGGSGLAMRYEKLAQRIQRDPEAFSAACEAMGGSRGNLGDLCYCVPLFPGICACLKFYFADEDFPASLTFLWDRNILRFVRYETVYYIADCLQKRLLQLMDH